MENRITNFVEQERKDAQPIAEILEELFAHVAASVIAA